MEMEHISEINENKNTGIISSNLDDKHDSIDTDCNTNKQLNVSVDTVDGDREDFDTTEMIKNNSEYEVLKNNPKLKFDLVVEKLANDITAQNITVTDNTTSQCLNYDSDDEVLQNVSRVKKKLAIADSDSEEENLTLAIPSDDEIEDSTEPVVEDGMKKKHKRLAIVDSDSDMENEVAIPYNKNFYKGVKHIEQIIFTTNSKGELIPAISNNDLVVQKSRLSMLCDSESSDEEVKENSEKDLRKELHLKADEEIKPKQYKKSSKTKKDEEENPKKMTGREAAELRKEIKSESQRMVREMNVSLPYHKPKSYTLKEFLARRPKLISANPLAARTPPSVAIKMSTEQLADISKKFKEREKEVKEFYKSESESEGNDGDEDYIPPENKEKSQDIDDGSKTTNGIPVNYEIADNNQDFLGDPQEKMSKIIDHSEESSLDKQSLKESGIVGAKANEKMGEVTITEKDEANNELLMNSDVCITNLNVANNLNDEKAEASNEIFHSTEEEVKGSETEQENNILTISEVNKSMLNTEDSSLGYEFNLDDLDENSEIPILEKDSSKDVTDKEKTRFEYTDLDREIESFCLNKKNKTDDSGIMVSKVDLIKERLANIKPKLSGGPDDVIDLETGVAKPNDVTRLMERFARHNLKKHMHKNKVKLSIVSVESGEVHEETVAMNVEDEDNLLEIEEKPGAKLQKLRDELQNQIAQKRTEFWQKKATKEINKEEDSTFEGEKEVCEAEDDFLDDEEEEAEMTDLSEDEDDDEDNGKDDELQDDPVNKEKSAFVDDEAEESDIDDTVEEDMEERDADTDTNNVYEIDLIDDENSKSSSITDEKSEQQPTKKTLRRIIKGFVEDSDDEEDIDLVSQCANSSGNINGNLCTTLSQDDDDFLPPAQPQNSRTPIRQITQNKSEFEFLTPISYITGLQNLNNSASKPLKNSPVTPHFQIANVPSPLKENNWQQSLHKKLFTDTEITDSQESTEFCSEDFSDIQEIKEADPVNEEMVNICGGILSSSLESQGNETQLEEVCSEVFPSTLEEEKENLSNCEQPSTQDLLDICSGKFTGITQSECTDECDTVSRCTTETYTLNTNKELKSLDPDQDMIISQLIDEEEMEKFKRKFDSPSLSNTQKRIVEEFEEVVGSGGVIDSDDEDETLEVKKKKQKRLIFSDDEDSDEDEETEIIDLHDDIDNEDDEDVTSNIPVDNIGYDSEENEIELTEQTAGHILKPSDFFENEAELSESEWGSADEDEKDLDTMEFEQGDAEKFNESKMRSDLEKIHMRRLLDDDTREVKLLQELLLEDGELHGTGRERQFRWKNIDSMNDGTAERKDEDDIYLDEEESEEQWRKKRHEREMFLKEQQKKLQHLEDDDLLSESQLLKIGHKVMQKSQPNSQGNTPVDTTKVTPYSPAVKQPFSLLNKRGSFLSRSDQVLQRLAEYNKVTTSVTLKSAKNSRNFLFQSVSVEETAISNSQVKKRKADDGTPNAIKKLRLSSNLSPAVGKKNPDKPKSAKSKLFGNW